MGNYFLGAISLGGLVLPSPKIVINLSLGPMRSDPVKENPIGSAASEILGTDKQTIILFFIIRINLLFEIF